MQKVKRLEPLPETKRQLFLLSRNKCAFANCEQILLDQSGHFIGEICHIEAANKGGERFNPSQTNEERRHISNLLLMCPTHHGVTNNFKEYPVSRMKEIKCQHEGKAYAGQELTYRESECFIDSSFVDAIPILNNIDELPLTEYNLTSNEIINSVNNFIQTISNVPRKTRSLYAYCILCSFGDDYLEFDPREVRNRLGITDDIFLEHAGVLQRYRLLSEIDNDDYPQILRQFIISPSKRDDNQIWFLIMLRELRKSNRELLLDIIENLNFIHLET